MENITKAIEIVKKGGIIIYPTDTAFGIGCRIDNHEAVDRLFRIRRRPMTQAMPVLVSSAKMSLAYLDHPSDIVRQLMATYWPGALTIVAPCKKNLIYSPIRGAGETIGVRMPNHKTPLQIIQMVGVPMLGPSANFHGGPTPYRQEDLDPELMKLVDFVVPGTCTLKQASTVVDCSVTPYKIIRQGAVKLLKIILFIDSSEQDAVKVGLEIDGKRFEKTMKSKILKAQTTLPLIEELLKEHKLTPQDVSEIMVHTGPGSYTGLRVGAAIANALGYMLHIPVNGQNKPVIPSY